jgi:hypothetical protein
MNGRRWGLPSLGTAVWLAFFLALTLSDWRLVMISADGDPCLHWRIGNWMIENHAVMRTDPFSHTRPGHPVVTMEWLTQVLYAGAGNVLGWNGFALLAAMAIATSLWLLHRQLLAEDNDLLLSTGMVLLAAMTCSMHWLARPHLASHVMLVIWNWQLRMFLRERLGAAQLFARLVPLMILWANLHAGFFTGLALIGIYFTGALTELWNQDPLARAKTKRRLATLALLGVSCLLASLLNPNGWRLHDYVSHFFSQPVLVGFVNEFRSPNFHSGGMQGFLLMLLTLGALLLAARPRFSLTDILVVGWATCFALYWARNVPVFALVVTPILAEHWNAFLRNTPDHPVRRYYGRVLANVTALDRVAGGWVLGMVVVGAVILVQAQRGIATEVLPSRFPVLAVEFLRKHPDTVRGEMFNDYGWGGYLILTLPERKVFVDGRNDFYGGALIEEFNRADLVQPGWEDVFTKYRVGWTILPVNHPLNQLLALRPDWPVVYADKVAVIRCQTTVRRPDRSGTS